MRKEIFYELDEILRIEKIKIESNEIKNEMYEKLILFQFNVTSAKLNSF